MSKEITDILHTIRHIYSCDGCIVVGAGTVKSPFVKVLKEASSENVTLIEGDYSRYIQLKEAFFDCGWSIRNCFILNNSSCSKFFYSSNNLESAFVYDESMRELWPNISTNAVDEVVTTSLDTFLFDNSKERGRWLVIDCFPSETILHGCKAVLSDMDVVVVRTLSDDLAVKGMLSSRKEVGGILSNAGHSNSYAIEIGPKGLIYLIFTKDNRALITQKNKQIKSLKDELSSQNLLIKNYEKEKTELIDENTFLKNKLSNVELSKEIFDSAMKKIGGHFEVLDQIARSIHKG